MIRIFVMKEMFQISKGMFQIFGNYKVISNVKQDFLSFSIQRLYAKISDLILFINLSVFFVTSNIMVEESDPSI